MKMHQTLPRNAQFQKKRDIGSLFGQFFGAPLLFGGEPKLIFLGFQYIWMFMCVEYCTETKMSSHTVLSSKGVETTGCTFSTTPCQD